MDKTILKLQQEKFEIQKTKNKVEELKQTSEAQSQELESTQEKIKEKLVDFQQLYDQELKSLQAGKRMNEWADDYLKTKNKKKLVANFLKWIEVENSKKTEAVQLEKEKEKIVQKEVKKELKKNKKEIVETQKKIEEKKEMAIQQSIDNLKPGDRVKIKDSNSVATVEKIEGKKVVLNYGQFTAKISIFDIYKI